MNKVVLLFTIIVAYFACFDIAVGQADIMYNPLFDIKSPGAKVIIVSPPGIFTLPGSQTTNFIQVCSLGEAFNLVFDVAGKNMVRFDDPIVDMCDNETIQNLDNYIQMDKIGEVSIDSEALPYLKDASAEVTMRNLPFDREPDIEVDGRPATDQDVKDKQWDKNSKILKFKAKHFTVYRAIAASAPMAYEENEQNKIAQSMTLYYSICFYVKYFVWFLFLLTILSSPLLFIKKEKKFKIIPVVLFILALFGFLLSSAFCIILDYF